MSATVRSAIEAASTSPTRLRNNRKIRLFTNIRNHALRLLTIAAILAQSTAAAMQPVTDIRQVALAEYAGCAVTLGGALRCFGNNGNGELGNGATGDYLKYAAETIAGDVSAVAMGDRHACAIVKSGLSCWGDDSAGQIGNGNLGGSVTRPVQVIAEGVTALAAGGDTTCAVVHGALYCWGRNQEGQVGTGKRSDPVATPTRVIDHGVTAVATGGQHTCAIVDRELKCWGFMLDRQGPGFSTLLTPTTFIAGGVTAVAAALHTCAVVDGALQCWGRNFSGQVGIGGPSVAPKVPTQVIAKGVTDVVADGQNTCAIVDAALYCWGSNSLGQFGARTPARADEPRKLLAAGVSAAAVGMHQVCAIVDGALQCTNRAPLDEQPSQDWLAFGTTNTPFSIPDPELPRLVRYGVWRGTIGKLDVMVKLEPEGCEASYYYLRHLWGIPLFEKDKRGAVWQEATGEPSATWTFESATPETADGHWTDGDGKRRLPIHLQRIAEGSKERYRCETGVGKAFDAPRIAAQKPAIAEAAFENHRYRTLSLFSGNVVSVEVPAHERRLPNLNKVMQAWQRTQILEYYGCQTALASRIDMKNPDLDFYQAMTPVVWNDRVLVLRENYSAYCGGAHPNAGIAGYVTWDLLNDKPIEPWEWIRSSKGEYGGYVAPEGLNRVIHAIAAAGGNVDDECKQATDSNASYLIYPTRTGMVFSPVLPHVVQACADDIEVPYAKLRPYLTPEGAAAVAALTGLQARSESP